LGVEGLGSWDWGGGVRVDGLEGRMEGVERDGRLEARARARAERAVRAGMLSCPETPAFLMSKGRNAEAEASAKRLWGDGFKYELYGSTGEVATAAAGGAHLMLAHPTLPTPLTPPAPRQSHGRGELGRDVVRHERQARRHLLRAVRDSAVQRHQRDRLLLVLRLPAGRPAERGARVGCGRCHQRRGLRHRSVAHGQAGRKCAMVWAEG